MIQMIKPDITQVVGADLLRPRVGKWSPNRYQAKEGYYTKSDDIIP